MNPEACYYICFAYISIAILSMIGLMLKRFKHNFKYPELIEYLLHFFHIPPYFVAAYWYYDCYKDFDVIST